MSKEDYFLLLLEEAHNARLFASLQMHDQELTKTIKDNKYDIAAQSRRKKVRVDIASMAGIIQVQTNLINAQMEKTYGIKFQSFTANDYKEILSEAKQVQESENSGTGADVRLEEGGEPRDTSGATQEIDGSIHEGNRSNLSVSAGGGD